MYLEHYGLKEPPFKITPHTEFFYAGANRGATLEALIYAVVHGEGLVKVTGEVGAGKTMLCRVLMEKLPATIDTVYLANPSLSREEILLAIADDLKLELDGARSTVLIRLLQDALIERFAAGRQVVVLIDEAHAMPPESLEEIRLLSNLEHGHHKLLQLVLFGQPELDTKLAVPEMRQLRERITHSFELAPLMRTDIKEYLSFRMRTAGYRGPDIFSASAIKLISAESEGLTRRINILADKSLLAAYATGKHEVTDRQARAAIKDSQFRPARWKRGQPYLAGIALLGLGLGLGLAIPQVGHRSPVTAPHSTAKPERPAPSVQPTTTVTPTTPAAAPTTPTSAVHPAPLQTAATTPDVVSTRLTAGTELLGTANAGEFAIQLILADRDNEKALTRFLEQAARSVPLDRLYIYPTQANGRHHYGVMLGLYPDQQSAMQALKQLPGELLSHRPLLRTVGGIRKEVGEKISIAANR